MNGRLAAFRRAIPEIARICKNALLAAAACAALCLLALAPALFGFRPFSIAESASEAYPVGALAYYRFVPADKVEPGMSIVLPGPEGNAVCTVAGKDIESRIFLVRISQEDNRTIPFEYAEGVPAAFCLPYGGIVIQALARPAVFCLIAVLIGLLAFGGLILPRWAYAPKYGKAREELQR